MSEDLLSRAARALREETADGVADGARTRAQVLARLDDARARRRRRLLVLLPIAATFLAGSVFGASGGRGAALVARVSEALGIAPAEESVSPPPRASRRSAPIRAEQAAPATSAPIAIAAPEPIAAPASETSARASPIRSADPIPVLRRPATTAAPAPQARTADPDDALYREAHRVHFVVHDPAGALVAWDRYLATAPTGRFALEARYNRAICLVRLGRTAEARTALEPFASAAPGAYRQTEAAQLLEALAP